MRIPGIGNIRNLKTRKAQEWAKKKLQAAGIRKSVRVIKAEYEDYVDRDKPSPKDRAGFLSVMNLVADAEAKEWIETERTRLDAIIELDKEEKERGKA